MQGYSGVYSSYSKAEHRVLEGSRRGKNDIPWSLAEPLGFQVGRHTVSEGV